MGHARKHQITIFPTNKCNMRCTYCAADSANHQTTTEKIDLEFARIGISDYFQDTSKHQIRYYSSGEPTQAMDVIKETWEYAHSIVGERLISELQTNCIFDKESADWIASHINIVWASIDGWPEVQNRYRPINTNQPSHYQAMQNALYIKEKTFVGIRTTIVEETVEQQIELLEYFNKLGFKEVASEPVFLPVKNGEKNDSPITCINLRSYIKNFVKAWYKAKELGMNYINSFMVNFDEKVEYACRSCLPTPHLTTDGYVSACDLGFYGNTPLQDLIYGKYDKENKIIQYFPEKMEKLRSRKCINIDSCKSCFVKENCGGGCLGRAYHETRDFYGVIPDYCWATRYLAANLPLDEIKIDKLHP